tara:strand:- start:1040 stop:1162 length:123 start_codon:yes stop_codon:yes gene_type:complete
MEIFKKKEYWIGVCVGFGIALVISYVRKSNEMKPYYKEDK